jgi:hypothetical protein
VVGALFSRSPALATRPRRVRGKRVSMSERRLTPEGAEPLSDNTRPLVGCIGTLGGIHTPVGVETHFRLFCRYVLKVWQPRSSGRSVLAGLTTGLYFRAFGPQLPRSLVRRINHN